MSAQSNYILSEIIINPKQWGHLVESSVGAHLINHSISERYRLFYWRESNQEVDFVLEKDGKVIAIEVKSGRRSANIGMSVFAQKFHPQKVLLVGTGGIGYEDFLRINPRSLFD